MKPSLLLLRLALLVMCAFHVNSFHKVIGIHKLSAFKMKLLKRNSPRGLRPDDKSCATSSFSSCTELPEAVRGMQPLGDMLLVERIKVEERKASGLLVEYKEGDNDSKRHFAKVLDISPQLKEQPNYDGVIKVGDVVYVTDPWGIGPKDIISDDKRQFSIVRASKVIAKVSS